MLVVRAEKRRKFTTEFREGAVRIVTETGKPVPEVAEDLGINETTPASWVSRAKRAGKATAEDRDALIARLTAENAALKKENKALGMEYELRTPQPALCVSDLVAICSTLGACHMKCVSPLETNEGRVAQSDTRRPSRWPLDPDL
ncbi:transposase [Streptomyces europaeiscabiei]|uniref:transposase n=1 Tax=Streptomyces TaxID=1883 RepID=UPI000A3D3F8F|nr:MULTISPECIES: transposase [Streptomyces]MDX3587675.1 transposase [Streptomyces europaeiscabiei]MDX3615970.1 transposase [Streptomyces europaeiscabiei]MDX3631852.1 transposase [Streptomyces europaeiscabiei]MDX3649633.1 transposase [Streptomyces europaeiscabiei]